MLVDLNNPGTQGIFGTALPLTVTDVADSDQYNTAIECFETATHGRLDQNNWSGGQIVYRQTQKGALVDGWHVGGTATLDYHAPLFGAVTNIQDLQGGGFGEGLKQQYAIPGASVRLDLKQAQWVLITWNVAGICDGVVTATPRPRSVVGLVIDDGYTSRRFLPGAKKPVISFNEDYLLYGYARQRSWGGHELVWLKEGYHDISLQVTADYRVYMTRIRNRSMQVLMFPGTTL